jgi:hypothetical protein
MKLRARLAAVVVAAALLAACAGDDDDPAGAPAATTPPTTAPVTPETTVAPAPPASATATPVDLCAYRDLGIWVDVFDSVAAFAEPGATSPVTPDDVATMAAEGARTLYLQVSRDDPRAPGLMADPVLAGEFLRAGHAAGMHVVAWYLATHADPARDLDKTLALVEFTADGERFDSIALDIEGTEAVADIGERNRRLLDLAAGLDDAAGDRPVGAIVYPPIAFDVLNTTLWPDFPWEALAPFVDVWLPMAYWTNRGADSPYRDAYRYTTENVERLRAHLDDPDAVVHVIGGIADEATSEDYEGFRRAATEVGAIGWSVYDFATLDPSAWPLLRSPSTC